MTLQVTDRSMPVVRDAKPSRIASRGCIVGGLAGTQAGGRCFASDFGSFCYNMLYVVRGV